MISQMTTSAKMVAIRSLTVLLLLDRSGSMEADGKIEQLNSAVRDMLAAMKAELEVSIKVGAIEFGSPEDTKELFPPTDVQDVEWQDLPAGGGTCLGQALRIAKAMIEDKERMPGHSYKPTVVVVSDGAPNDDWEEPMKQFCHEGRSSKCFRWAMGIGCDQEGERVLKSFISSPELYFHASDASGIPKFFDAVTMSTIQRAKGTTQMDMSFGFSAAPIPPSNDDDDII